MLLNFTYSNDHDFIYLQEETRKCIEKVLFLGFILPVCFVGIPSNLINCVVFRRQGLQDRMNFCLFFSALVDCLYLVCTLTIFPISSLVRLYDDTLGEEYYLKTSASLTGVLYAFRNTSGFIAVVIAVERCVCVWLPLKASTFMRTRTMCIMLTSSLLLFQGVFSTHPILLRVIWTKKKTSENWRLVHTQFYHDNRLIFVILHIIILDVLVPVATFLILVTMTIITVIKLKVAMSWRQRSAAVTRNVDPHQTSLTVMLLIVSTVHIVTMIPFVAWHVVYFFIPDPFNTYYTTLMTLKGVINSFPTINSSIQFFIYYFRSSRFRIVLQNMFFHFRNQSLQKANCTERNGKL